MGTNFLGLVNGEELNRVRGNRNVGKTKRRRHQQVGQQNFTTLRKFVEATKIHNPCEIRAYSLQNSASRDQQFLQNKT